MRAADILEKKKRGLEHSKEEIDFLIESLMNGGIEDYQLSAWLMAVCIRGMSVDETTYLTQAFVDSGETLDFSAFGGKVIDKHSSGGVGDKVTLILIPLLAAAGCICAKLSGRGLSFTGGTIDKLESIPGFNTGLTNEQFLTQVEKIGAAIASQTTQLTPADAKFYALRDVTATVDNLSLICASIVSKKIASGADHILLDVKCGSGAFIKDLKSAKSLAHLMVEVGKRLNRNIKAVITDMSQPLGFNIGNSLEVIEALEVLKGHVKNDLYEVSLELGAISLVMSKICATHDEAREKLEKIIESGAAVEKFREIISAQGGDTRIIEDYGLLRLAPVKRNYIAEISGYISGLDALTIAKACKMLGAGREKKSDTIDYGVGIVLHKKIGSRVEKGETLFELYANPEKGEELTRDAMILAESAFTFSDCEPYQSPLIIATL